MTPPALSLRPCSRLPYGRLGVLAPGLGSLDCVLSLDVTGSQQLGTCPGSVVFCCSNSVIVSALERQGLAGPISGGNDRAKVQTSSASQPPAPAGRKHRSAAGAGRFRSPSADAARPRLGRAGPPGAGSLRDALRRQAGRRRRPISARRSCNEGGKRGKRHREQPKWSRDLQALAMVPKTGGRRPAEGRRPPAATSASRPASTARCRREGRRQHSRCHCNGKGITTAAHE